MLKKIRGERQEGTQRGRLALGLGGGGDKAVAKDLVRIGKVIGGEEDSDLWAGSVAEVSRDRMM